MRSSSRSSKARSKRSRSAPATPGFSSGGTSRTGGPMHGRMIGAVLLVAAGMMPEIAGAQSPEATISGVITDATGGALPGVAVTAIHGQTGQRHAAVTNAEGFYALRALPIGPYVIDAELSGFHRYRGEGLRLTTGATVPLDIKLAIGELTDTVTVLAEAPLLSARTSEMSQDRKS